MSGSRLESTGLLMPDNPSANDPRPETDYRRELADAVERYHRPLVGYARTLLRNPETARDAAQDTLLKLCQQTETQYRLQIEPRLAAWLFTVCRNRAFDILRKDRPMTVTDTAQIDSSNPATGPGPSAAAELHDDQRALLTLVADLPGQQREVVQLRFQGGLTYKQISEVTGQSVSYVGFLLHQAMATLREQMKQITT